MMSLNRIAVVAIVAALASCGTESNGGDELTPAIAISPRTRTVTAGGAGVVLTATLSGGASGAVTWSLGAGNQGSLDPTTGATTTYTPPASGGPTTVTVTATMGTLTDRATITVLAAVPSVSVAPRTATVTAGGAGVVLTATLSGGASGTITWSTCGPGTLDPTTGATTTFTPPPSVATTTAVTVSATVWGVGGSGAVITVQPAGSGITAEGTVRDENGDAADARGFSTSVVPIVVCDGVQLPP